jgi:opacity protein-like surface antigen
MTARSIVLAAMVMAGFAGAAMAAETVPDLKGTWTGTFTGGVRQGGGQLAPTDETGRFVHPGDRDYTLTVKEQDGRGFKGTWGSTLGTETLQGVIRLDNKTILMVDTDSLLEATLLSPTEMEFCNHTVTATDHFSFCFLLKKQ